MKRKYVKPIIKLVDFEYEEQIVAASAPCVQYNHWSFEYPTTTLCVQKLQDIAVARMFSNCIEIANEA